MNNNNIISSKANIATATTYDNTIRNKNHHKRWSDNICRNDFFQWLKVAESNALSDGKRWAKFIVSYLISNLLWTENGVCYHSKLGQRRPITFVSNFDDMVKELEENRNSFLTAGAKWVLTTHIMILKQYKQQRYPLILRQRENERFVNFLASTKPQQHQSDESNHNPTSILGNKEVTGIMKLTRSFVVGDDILQGHQKPMLPRVEITGSVAILVMMLSHLNDDLQKGTLDELF